LIKKKEEFWEDLRKYLLMSCLNHKQQQKQQLHCSSSSSLSSLFSHFIAGILLYILYHSSQLISNFPVPIHQWTNRFFFLSFEKTASDQLFFFFKNNNPSIWLILLRVLIICVVQRWRIWSRTVSIIYETLSWFH
jgi:hypothetical protein